MNGLHRSGRFALLLALVAAATAIVGAVKANEAMPSMMLDQGWDAATRHRFYYESQGTQFMPAAMLEALEAPSGGRFMAPQSMRRFGFLIDEKRQDASNPYGWPVGLVVDRPAGQPAMAGFTCAACHTSELRYRGTAIRIDGGQATIDVNAFRRALAEAVIVTGKDPARRGRFEKRAVEFGFPATHIAAAFERSYREALHGATTPPDYVVDSTPSGPGRLDALAGIATAVFALDLGVPGNAPKGSAPVDFPYLWNIWHFDWVQYNASVRQPMFRNIGEALGVGVKTNFIDEKTGALNPEPLRWRTTARVHSLYWMEDALTELKPPAWPEEVLGKIDRPLATRGRALFVQNCAACHGVKRIEGTEPVEWHVSVIPLKTIGTDPNQAVDYARNTYDATKLGLGNKAHTPDALGYVVTHVQRQAYIDAGIPKAEWGKYDGFDRKADLFPAPCGYKARPLVGVWATAPFLHNGSVPSLFALLSDSRPSSFSFGSREFDPKNVGFAQTGGPGTMAFDPSLPGNSNAGHWFTNDRSRPGRIGRAFSDTEKYAVIEYLKSATFADYPATSVAPPGPLPCQNDKEWTKAY